MNSELARRFAGLTHGDRPCLACATSSQQTSAAAVYHLRQSMQQACVAGLGGLTATVDIIWAVRPGVDFSQISEAIRQLGLYWPVLNEAPPLGKEAIDWPGLSTF